jgi:hypothetical protein
MPNPYPPKEPRNRDTQWWLLLAVATLLVLAVVIFAAPEGMPSRWDAILGTPNPAGVEP